MAKLSRVRAEPEPPAVNVMLDSGAYSAWFHGAPLDLGAYINYIQEHRALFDSIVALDQIPGKNRAAAKTAADVEAAARKSFGNYELMRKAGLKEAIPVFHQGEDWSWLERMVRAGIEYIGISPYPRAGQPSILHWLDDVFSRICDEAGEPLVKTHGFGATSWGMITRYPWFSIDSTTWALAAGYGTIILPHHVSASSGLLPAYDLPPLRFSISDRDTAGSRPFLKEGPTTRALIESYMARAGLSLSDVRASDRYRAELNAYYYCRLEDSLSCAPFKYRTKGVPATLAKRLVRFNFRPRVIFAEQMGKNEYGRALQRLGARNRLISYYESRKVTEEQLTEYCTTGILEKPDLAPKKRGSEPWIVNRRIGLLKRLKEPDPNA